MFAKQVAGARRGVEFTGRNRVSERSERSEERSDEARRWATKRNYKFVAERPNNARSEATSNNYRRFAPRFSRSLLFVLSAPRFSSSIGANPIQFNYLRCRLWHDRKQSPWVDDPSADDLTKQFLSADIISVCQARKVAINIVTPPDFLTNVIHCDDGTPLMKRIDTVHNGYTKFKRRIWEVSERSER